MPRPSLKTLLRAFLTLITGIIQACLTGLFITCIIVGLFMAWPPLAFIIGGIIGLIVIAD